MTQDMPLPTRRSLPISLLRARESVMARFRPMLATHDVTEQQWRVLRVLAEHERMEAGGLAEQACILPPSLSRIIKALQARGLIRITRDATDGRRTMLSLAAGGRRLLDSAALESAAVYAEIEHRFGKQKISELLDLLDRLQVSLGEDMP